MISMFLEKKFVFIGFLFFVFLGNFQSSACCVAEVIEKQQRPNILFVLVDDQRNSSLGCAGHPQIKTPNIDRLAKNGVRFENAFVTTSICMASRACLFTGLTERSHGYTGGGPPATPLIRQDVETSYPTLLQKAGYRTGFFGKQHVKFQKNVSGMKIMFDSYKALHRNPYFKKMPDGTKRHVDEIMADYSIKFLKSQPKSQPFFLTMNFNISHAEDRDYRPGIGHFPWPKKEDGLFNNVEPVRPQLAADKYFQAAPDFLKKSLNRQRYFWRWDTPEKYRTNMRAYYRMLAGMDRIVGRVLTTIRKLKRFENTVVIYAADNGYYMGDRGFAGKWSHFEESLRVPLIVADPRLPKKLHGRLLKQMVLNLDIPATILELANVAVPKKYQGRSLKPLLQNQNVNDWRTEFYCEHHFHLPKKLPKWYGVRTTEYTYANYYEHKKELLYDLKKDPTQLKNVAELPAYQQQLKKLRQRTQQYVKQYTRPVIVQFKAKQNKTKRKPTKKNEPPVTPKVEQPKTAASKTAPPNIVLLISDDQGWTDYGFMGHPKIRTPCLDRLAKQSVLFTRGYVPTAVCRPSLMTLATGRYAHQHHVTGNDPIASPENIRHAKAAGKKIQELLISKVDRYATLPKILANNGYQCFQCGKWWEGSYQRGGFTQGMTRGFPNKNGRHGDKGLTIGRQGMTPVFDFIDTAVQKKKPFFVWYAPFMPHTPHTPPGRFLKKYQHKGCSKTVAKYYAMCEWFDETCGQLLDHLEKKGIAKNTLIVYICDNGWIQLPTKNGYAARSKRSPYEGGVRTPILFRWPGKIQPAKRTELCSSIDIMPTILAAANAKCPPTLPGLNLLPQLQQGTPISRDTIYGEAFAHDIADINNPQTSLLARWVIHKQTKLILTYDGRQGKVKYRIQKTAPQLYDLKADPHEKNNLAAKHPDQVKKLTKLIENWWAAPQRKQSVKSKSIIQSAQVSAKK